MSRRDNALQGGFGEAWLATVAAGCGILPGRVSFVDADKSDLPLTLLEELPGAYHPKVEVQVKTEQGLREGTDGMFSYNLDISTYNVLRRKDSCVMRVLVVIGLTSDGCRIRMHEDGTLLVGRGAWVSLIGKPPSSNTETQVVKLPVTNTLDPAGLRRMILECGVRSSTLVPAVDVWQEPEQLSKEDGDELASSAAS